MKKFFDILIEWLKRDKFLRASRVTSKYKRENLKKKKCKKNKTKRLRIFF